MDYLLKNQSDIAKMSFINLPGTNTDIYGPSGFVDAGLGFQDKRNRNPNWTDHEINRFLEMLQEDDTVKDLVANRNKKVFCMIAQRMCSEGAEKTWDQCRIKLKNLKSQYRYVKERIPNIDDLDLEDDDVVRQLIAECQGRGISPSSIKHLRSLLRFLNKQKDFAKKSGVPSDFLNSSSSSASHPSSSVSSNNSTIIATPQPFVKRNQITNQDLTIKTNLSINNTQMLKIEDDRSSLHYEDDAVSPPSSPTPGVKIFQGQSFMRKKVRGDQKIIAEYDEGMNDIPMDSEISFNKKKSFSILQPSTRPKPHSVNISNIAKTKNSATSFPKLQAGRNSNSSSHESSLMEDDYKFIERFNRDMMDQFMEHQRRTQASFTRWEQERWRQERETMERWRQEARDHERQLFGMFCSAMTKCNAALTSVMRARRYKDTKQNSLENGMTFANGTQSVKSQTFSGSNLDMKNFDRSITIPKKRKLDSDQLGQNKTIRTSNEGIEGSQHPNLIQEESDVAEHDSPGNGLYVNENSLEEPAEEGSVEDNEQYYEKDELDDEDRVDD